MASDACLCQSLATGPKEQETRRGRRFPSQGVPELRRTGGQAHTGAAPRDARVPVRRCSAARSGRADGGRWAGRRECGVSKPRPDTCACGSKLRHAVVGDLSLRIRVCAGPVSGTPCTSRRGDAELRDAFLGQAAAAAALSFFILATAAATAASSSSSTPADLAPPRGSR